MTYLPPQQVLPVSPSQFHTPEQSVSAKTFVFSFVNFCTKYYKLILILNTDILQSNEKILFSLQREDLSSQYSHMTLSHSSLGETSDLSTYYMHGAPPTHSYTQPQQTYASPYTADNYMSSGMTLAMATAQPTQTCGQQSNQVLL